MVKGERPAMTIHVIGSAQHLEEDWPYFKKIMHTIHEHAYTLALNWIEPAYINRVEGKGGEHHNIDYKTIFENNVEALARADLLVVEGTWYSFSQGYQTAIALQQKKPVLMVQRDKTLDRHLASGITDELFVAKTYHTEADLEKIVHKFIQDNTLTSKDLRFNFFIDNEIYNHLRWASFKSGKTKAEIIRELIDKEIEKSEY